MFLMFRRFRVYSRQKIWILLEQLESYRQSKNISESFFVFFASTSITFKAIFVHSLCKKKKRFTTITKVDVIFKGSKDMKRGAFFEIPNFITNATEVNIFEKN